MEIARQILRSFCNFRAELCKMKLLVLTPKYLHVLEYFYGQLEYLYGPSKYLYGQAVVACTVVSVPAAINTPGTRRHSSNGNH